METVNKQLDVAQKVCACIANAGLDGNDPEVLEGVLLAMMMLGGPKYAAQVIGYCSLNRD